jgi:hypothetical protein
VTVDPELVREALARLDVGPASGEEEEEGEGA